MSDKPDGGPAFAPHGAPHPTDPTKAIYGMTLRDYFAAQAMIGIMSTAGGFDRADRRVEMVAEKAFQFADAMLAERSK